MANNIDSITAVGTTATKYKYVNGQISYRLTDIKILIKGDSIKINYRFLYPSDSQNTIDVLYGQISNKFGTNTPEEYVDYLIVNNIV